MNSRLMYSSVVLVTGMNRVLPGLFAFHWLKSNRPGSVVGRGARPGMQLHPGPPVELEDPLDLRLERLARERADLAGLGDEPEHVQQVGAGVVGEEELGAVVGARGGPGAGGPLHQRAHAPGGVEVPQVEAGEAGAGRHHQRLLELGERHGLVGAAVVEHRGLDLHAQAHAPALAVEDGLEEGVREGVHEPRGGGPQRLGDGLERVHSPSSRAMMSCWISLVPSVMEASLASR